MSTRDPALMTEQQRLDFTAKNPGSMIIDRGAPKDEFFTAYMSGMKHQLRKHPPGHKSPARPGTQRPPGGTHERMKYPAQFDGEPRWLIYHDIMIRAVPRF